MNNQYTKGYCWILFLSVIYPLRKGKNRNCPPPYKGWICLFHFQDILMFLGLVYSLVPLLYSSSNKMFSKDKLCNSVKIFLQVIKLITKNICEPESFNTNISHQLFDYTITFENSHHENTYSKWFCTSTSGLNGV